MDVKMPLYTTVISTGRLELPYKKIGTLYQVFSSMQFYCEGEEVMMLGTLVKENEVITINTSNKTIQISP